ncbi:hypothetical protein [Streptomyces corynorhini]|uniref:hypothetical protein n=1 Tax=Streptomyces corynorhini TaxID=2282652 RepID=UPI00131447CB|nr:hypothetical protein [Streptomyces corynorhini]
MNALPHPPATHRSFPVRLLRWLKSRRHAAAGHMLRGACYGIGTGIAGLLVLWVQKFV